MKVKKAGCFSQAVDSNILYNDNVKVGNDLKIYPRS